MFKWIKRKLLPVRHTELALEIREALENDEWEVCEYTIKHRASSMELWVSDTQKDSRFFHIHRGPNGALAKNLSMTREEAQSLMTKEDHQMLHALALQVLQKRPKRQAVATLNALRLARQTGEQP